MTTPGNQRVSRRVNPLTHHLTCTNVKCVTTTPKNGDTRGHFRRSEGVCHVSPL